MSIVRKGSQFKTSKNAQGTQKYFYPGLPSWKSSKSGFIIVIAELIGLLFSGVHDAVFLANSLAKIGIGKGQMSFISPIVLAGLLIFILIFTMFHAGGKKAEQNQGAKTLWCGWVLAVMSIVTLRIFNVIGEVICNTPASELNPTPCAGKPTTWGDTLISDQGISGLSEILLLTTFTFLTALLAYSLGKTFLNKNLNDLRYLDKKLNNDRDAINQDLKDLETIGEKPKAILDEYIYYKNETKDDMKKYRDDVFQLILDEYVTRSQLRHDNEDFEDVVRNSFEKVKDELDQEEYDTKKMQENMPYESADSSNIFDNNYDIDNADIDNDSKGIGNQYRDVFKKPRKKNKKKNKSKDKNKYSQSKSGSSLGSQPNSQGNDSEEQKELSRASQKLQLQNKEIEIILRDKITKENEVPLASGTTQEISEIIGKIRKETNQHE